MTKVELQYDLVRKLEDADADSVDRAHAVYGIERVQIGKSLDRITVDSDASRLSRPDVEGALVRCGVPIRRTA